MQMCEMLSSFAVYLKKKTQEDYEETQKQKQKK